jgi:hypothetical protein
MMRNRLGILISGFNLESLTLIKIKIQLSMMKILLKLI